MVGNHIVRWAGLQIAAVFRRSVDDWIVGSREDSRDVAGILRVRNGGARENSDIGVELVVGLSAIFEVIAVANRRLPDVAREQHALSGM